VLESHMEHVHDFLVLLSWGDPILRCVYMIGIFRINSERKVPVAGPNK
jgi:hypothetical protein